MIYLQPTIEAKLCKKANKKRKLSNERFFKTEEGEYGYGDKFIGVSMPEIRKIAKEGDVTYREIMRLLDSDVHEYRMCGFLILASWYKNNKEQTYKRIVTKMHRMNNWDIVDVIVPKTIGVHILTSKTEKRKILKLTNSKNIWYRRVAVLSCFPAIKNNDTTSIFYVAKKLFKDKHDLIHKAVGWMLREAYKVQPKETESFLIEHYKNIPRTTLRYSIERMPEKKRKQFLNM